MKKMISYALIAALALPATASMSTASYALSKKYCDSYATKRANKKANKRVLEGLALGALTGLAIGSIAGNSKKDATAGLIIGGVGGTALGGISANEKWRKVYRKEYKLCRKAPDVEWLYDHN